MHIAILSTSCDSKFMVSKRRLSKGETKYERLFFDTLFQVVSTRCGLRASEITVQISRNYLFIFCSFFPNVCSPNEDFGRSDKHLRVRLRSTFQGCEYSIWATHPWKVLRKRALKCLSDLPKSSFGRVKLTLKLCAPNEYFAFCTLLYPSEYFARSLTRQATHWQR